MKASKTLITLTHSSIDGLHQERAMKMRIGKAIGPCSLVAPGAIVYL